MPAVRKKVIVRKWTQEWLRGYLAAIGLPDPEQVALLGLDGTMVSVPIKEVKWICYVRDFSGGDPNQPERLLQKSFVRKPRNPGVWLRVRLQDNDVIEGLAQNDLTLLDGNVLSCAPPDARSNTQRIVLPRAAIRELEILAVIRAGSPKPSASTASSAPSPEFALQPSLFKQGS